MCETYPAPHLSDNISLCNKMLSFQESYWFSTKVQKLSLGGTLSQSARLHLVEY